MVISNINNEDITKYSLVTKEGTTLIGLYDTIKDGEVNVNTDLLAYMYITTSKYKKKNIILTDGGVIMLRPSLALLKVLELELIKYLNSNKLLFIETYLNDELDLKKCSLKVIKENKLATPPINHDAKYFRIYKNKITKYINI